MTHAAGTRSARRGPRHVGIILAIAAFALLRPGIAAEARPLDLTAVQRLLGGEPSAFVDQINLLRSTLGMRPLAVSDQLTRVATSWSEHMAAQGGISHNPNLPSQVSGWSGIAENVGSGWSVLSLMDAFVASPHHYVNLVNPDYTLVGVGVAFGSDGAMYTTHNFMTPEEAYEPQPAPEPDPEPTPRPRTPRPTQPVEPSPPTTVAPTPEPPAQRLPQPTEARVAAVLAPLRSLELR